MSTDAHRLSTADTPAHANGNSLAVTALTNVADLLAIAETLAPNDRLRLVAAIWGSLPPSHPSAASSKQLAELQRCLTDYDAARPAEFPWATITQLMAGTPPERLKTIYSVPRRFDLSTIFVVTLAYSLLFGAMSAMSFPPAASISIGGFITLIAASQALLFGGKRPRTASIMVGSLIFAGATLALWIANGQRIYPPAVFVLTAGYTIAAGTILGYLSGTIVGGIFLIADKCRSRFARKREDSADGGIYPASECDSPWAN